MEGTSGVQGLHTPTHRLTHSFPSVFRRWTPDGGTCRGRARVWGGVCVCTRLVVVFVGVFLCVGSRGVPVVWGPTREPGVGVACRRVGCQGCFDGGRAEEGTPRSSSWRRLRGVLFTRLPVQCRGPVSLDVPIFGDLSSSSPRMVWDLFVCRTPMDGRRQGSFYSV